MLGVIIGVAAVIAMMEISQGASKAIQVTVVNMGANTLMVTPGAPKRGSPRFGDKINTLTPDDVEAIERECPSVRCAAPLVNAWGQVVVYGNRSWSLGCLTGSTAAFLEARNWKDMQWGRVFSDREVLGRSKVCLLGTTVVRELFHGRNPVGAEIRVKNVPFTVIGVLSEKGANLLGTDQDDILLAPWTTVKDRVSGGNLASVLAGKNLSAHAPPGLSQAERLPSAAERLLRSDTVQQILVKARSPALLARVQGEITTLLHDRHHLAEGETDFRIYDNAEVSNALKKTVRLLSGLAMIVAAVSLLVGGVGIMNIMLVSVTERTREIGLRMAVGADAWDILWQFLVEAVVLCLVGGFIGILLGRGEFDADGGDDGLADAAFVRGGCHRGGRFRPRGSRFRLLSRLESLAVEPHRRAAVRIRGALRHGPFRIGLS